jgi:hypothetical protein
VVRNEIADDNEPSIDPVNSWNNNRPVVPLRQSAKLETLEWFGHEELKEFPPADGEFMELESGGVLTGRSNDPKGQSAIVLIYQASCRATGRIHLCEVQHSVTSLCLTTHVL